jgi:hypothetical protein
MKVLEKIPREGTITVEKLASSVGANQEVLSINVPLEATIFQHSNLNSSV